MKLMFLEKTIFENVFFEEAILGMYSMLKHPVSPKGVLLRVSIKKFY